MEIRQHVGHVMYSFLKQKYYSKHKTDKQINYIYIYIFQWTIDKKVGERKWKMGNGKGINSSWTQTVPMRQPLS